MYNLHNTLANRGKHGTGSYHSSLTKFHLMRCKNFITSKKLWQSPSLKKNASKDQRYNWAHMSDFFEKSKSATPCSIFLKFWHIQVAAYLRCVAIRLQQVAVHWGCNTFRKQVSKCAAFYMCCNLNFLQPKYAANNSCSMLQLSATGRNLDLS